MMRCPSCRSAYAAALARALPSPPVCVRCCVPLHPAHTTRGARALDALTAALVLTLWLGLFYAALWLTGGVFVLPTRLTD